MKTELQVVNFFISHLLRQGYHISVNDGVEFVVSMSRNKKDILAAMYSTGEDYITPYKDGKRIGFFWLIYGNNPDEVIADYSANETCDAIWNTVMEYAEA